MSLNGFNIISSLTVISDVGFNNTNVTCVSLLGDEVQQTLAIVLGEKSFIHGEVVWLNQGYSRSHTHDTQIVEGLVTQYLDLCI